MNKYISVAMQIYAIEIFFFIPVGVSLSGSECECIEPCEREMYHPMISYSALTDKVIQEILGPGNTELRQKHRDAIDNNDRISKVSHHKKTNYNFILFLHSIL